MRFVYNAIQNNVRQRNNKKKNRRIERRSDRREKLALRELFAWENSVNVKLRLSSASPALRHSLSFSQSLRIIRVLFFIFLYAPLSSPSSSTRVDASQSVATCLSRQTNSSFFAQRALARAFTLEVKDEESVLRFLLYRNFSH